MPSQVFTNTTQTSWDWPTGVTVVTVELLGGGGNGGAATGNPSTGGGGKGGTYIKATVTKGTNTYLFVNAGFSGLNPSFVSRDSVTVVRAANGANGAAASVNSTNGAGGTTESTTNLASGTGVTLLAGPYVGGNGGTGNFTSGVQGSGAGGGAAGPTGTGGAASVNVAGIAGTGTWANDLAYQSAGAAGVGNSLNGANAVGYGSGGSGGKASNNTDRTGGNGTQGIVLLTWEVGPPSQNVTTVRIASTAVLFSSSEFIHEDAGWFDTSSITPGSQTGQAISGHTGSLMAISLFLNKATAAVDTSELTVQVAQGGWSGTVLGTSNAIAVDAVGTTAAWVQFTFPTPIALTGPTVVFKLLRTTSATYKSLWWRLTTDLYPGGTSYTNLGGIASQYDLEFKLHLGGLTVVADIPVDKGITTQSIASTVTLPGGESKTIGCNESFTGGAWGSSGQSFCGAQSITGPISRLSKVSFLLQQTVQSGDSLYVTVNQGALNGTVLAMSGVVSTASLPVGTGGTGAYAMVDFAFDLPFDLASGTAVIQLYRTGSLTGTIWMASGNNSYSGGLLYDNSGTPDASSRDYGFRLYTVSQSHVVFFPPPEQNVSGSTIAGTTLVRTPTVVPGPVTVTTATRILTTVLVRVPTVVPGDVDITGGTRASTAIVRVPSVAVAPITILAATRTTTLVVNEPLLAPGPVTVGGATIGATNQRFVPSLVPGQVAVTTDTIASTAQVRVPSLASGPVTTGGSHAASTLQMFVPSVMVGAVPIVGATIGATNQQFVPSVVPDQAVTTDTIISTAQVRVPSLVVGSVAGGGHRATTLQMFAMAVTVGAVMVGGSTISATNQRFVPSVVPSQAVTTAAIASTVQVRVPSVGVGPGTTGGAHRPTTIQMFVMVVTRGAVTVTAAHCVSTAVVSVPTVGSQAVTIITGTIASTEQVRVPSIVPPGGWKDLRDGMVAHWQMAESVASDPAEDVHANYDLYMIGTGQNAQNPIDGTPARDFEADSSNYLSTQQPVEQSVTTASITSTVQMLVTAVSPGPVGVTTPVVASALVMLAPVVAATVKVNHCLSTLQMLTPAVFAPPLTLIRANHILSGLKTLAPAVAPGPVAVVAGTRASASLAFTPAVVVPSTTAVGAGTRSASSVLSTPSIGAGPVTVGGSTIGATGWVMVPSIDVGPVIVKANHRLSTIQLFAPSLTGTLTGAHIASVVQAFSPLVTSIQAVFGATIPVSHALFAAAVDVGAVTVKANHRLSTVALYPPSFVATLDGTFRASTAQLFAPTVLPTHLVTGASLPTGSVLLAPSVTTVASVTGGHHPTTLQLRAPTLTMGPVEVGVGHRLTTLQSFAPTVAVTVSVGPLLSALQLSAPTVAVGDVTVNANHRLSTAQLFAPTIYAPPFLTVRVNHCLSTLQMLVPSVATGPVVVGAGTCASVSLAFTPTVVTGTVTIGGGTRPSTTVLFPPSFVARLNGTFIASSAQTYAPIIKISQFVTTAPVVAGSAPFAPSLGAGAVGIDAAHRGTETLLFEPTVDVGPVSVRANHRLSTIRLFTPSLTDVGAITVKVNHRLSTVVLFAPSLTGAPTAAFITSTAQAFAPVVTSVQAISGATIPSGSALFAASVDVGAVTVKANHRLSTAVLFPPSFVSALDGSFITSTARVFTPLLTSVQAISGAFVPAGENVFAPAVGPGPILIKANHRLSTIAVYSPSVITTVEGVFCASTVQVFAPTVRMTQFVSGLFVPAGHVLFVPSTLAVTLVGGSTCAKATVLFAPSLTVGDVTVQTTPLPSTLQLHALTLVPVITAPTIASASVVFAPTFIGYVETALWVVSTHLYPPGVSHPGEVYLPAIGSEVLIFPPQMVGYAPPAEILDVESNLVRAITGDLNLCRDITDTAILTRGVAVVTTIERVVEMTPTMLRREFAVAVVEPPSEIDVVAVLTRSITGEQNLCRVVNETVILTRGVSVETRTGRTIDVSPSLVGRELTVGVER